MSASPQTAAPPPSPHAPELYRLHGHLIDLTANRIEGPTGVHRVEPKVMAVLQCFLAHPGETLTTDALLAEVWGDVVVEENALRRAISQLRKLFGDDARHPAVIETIPKRGYRLIAPVRTEVPLATTPQSSGPRRTLKRYVTQRLFWSGALFCGAVGTWLLLALTFQTEEPVLQPRVRIPLTSLPGYEMDPALSPDGQAVAFVHIPPGSSKGDLYLQHIGNGPPRAVAQTPAMETAPAWDPAGNILYFLRIGYEGCSVRAFSVVDDTETMLSACPGRAQFHLDAAPDGQWLALALQEARGKPYYLARFHLADRSWHLDPDTTQTSRLLPQFSPDGQQLAFAERTGQQTYLSTRPSAGGPVTQRVQLLGDYAGFTWAPDGQGLIYSSNHGGNYRFWHTSLADEQTTWLAELGAYDPSSPAFARHSSRMTYVEWTFEFNLWQIPLGEEGAPRPFLSSTKWDLHPAFSPDGQHLAFTSNRNGSNALWLADAEGQQPRLRYQRAGAFLSTPRWSPDGQQIAFELYETGSTDLYVIDRQGGRPRRLTQSPAEDRAPSWSPDGQWIYFGSRRRGQWDIWRMPAQGTGAAEPVTTEGGYAGHVSSDGETLYFVKRHQRGLWRQSVTGGPATRVLDDIPWYDWGLWVLTTDAIYYVDRTPFPHTFIRYHLATGATDTLGTATAAIPGNKAGLTLAPDGSSLVYVQADRDESDIYLIEPRK